MHVDLYTFSSDGQVVKGVHISSIRVKLLEHSMQIVPTQEAQFAEHF